MWELMTTSVDIVKFFFILLLGLMALAMLMAVFIKAACVIFRMTGYPGLLGLTVLPKLANWFFENNFRWVPRLFLGNAPSASGLVIHEKGAWRVGQDIGATVLIGHVCWAGWIYYSQSSVSSNRLVLLTENIPVWSLITFSVAIRWVFWLGAKAQDKPVDREGFAGTVGILDTIDRTEIPKPLDKLAE